MNTANKEATVRNVWEALTRKIGTLVAGVVPLRQPERMGKRKGRYDEKYENDGLKGYHEAVLF